jgi:hypothetical protein
MERINIIGQKYGRLTVLKYHSTVDGEARWVCRCDCGVIKDVRGKHLRYHKIVSCGCYNRDRTIKENTAHGCSNTKIHRTWMKMLNRCNNVRDRAYLSYGARGIYVCKRWTDSFQAFKDDMGVPQPHESIDRVDNDGPYSPENCRWATQTMQMNNTRVSVKVSLNDMTMTLTQWERLVGTKRKTIANRLRHGWAPAFAVLSPMTVRMVKFICLRGHIREPGESNCKSCGVLATRAYRERLAQIQTTVEGRG